MIIKRKTFGIKKKTHLKARRAKKKRIPKIALWREFGVPDGAYKRYTGLKGIYWHYFSRYIKQRDYEMWDGMCITCGYFVEREDAQTCHTFAAKKCGFGLLFHPLNNHLGHSKCNNPRFTPGAGVLDGLHVEQRYGTGTIEMLLAIKAENWKEWSKAEYISRIHSLRSELGLPPLATGE